MSAIEPARFNLKTVSANGLPENGGAHAHADTERGQPVAPAALAQAVGRIIASSGDVTVVRANAPQPGPVGTALQVGDLVIDTAAHRVTRAGEEIHLTPIEFELLRVLAQHLSRLVTHRQLLQAVWGPEYGEETHYLRVHVAHIRAKVEADPSRPEYLLTEPGVGYRLRDPAA